MANTVPLRLDSSRSTYARTGLAIAVSAVLGSVGGVVVASIARAAGVSGAFKPLQVGAYVPLVIIAAVVGAVGWTLIVRRSADSRAVLRRLVPAVVVLSLVPDLLVGFGDTMAHTTWGGVATLMIMHLVVAAALVAGFAHFLPPKGSRA